MKKRKLISAFLSIALVAVLASGSAAGGEAEPSKEKVFSPVLEKASEQIISDAPEFHSNSAERTTEQTVEINSSTFKQFENEDDTFYEPTQESISVLEDSTAYINDAVTVFFDDNATPTDKARIVRLLDGEIVGKVDYMNEYEIKIDRADFYEINALCDELMRDDSVEFASCSFAEQVSPDYVPDDPWGYSALWDEDALESDYPFSNWWIKATDIDKAWDYDEYFSDIDVGIVDSGFYTDHEELKNKIVFPNKFFEENNAPSYHGNHVAGIIGAEQDNEKGISGIVRDGRLICIDWQANEEQEQVWNNDARIMTGFVNAVRAGAKVVNFSLGSSAEIKNGIDRLKIVKDAEGKFSSYYIAKMLQRGYDFICCQSAGNGVYKDGEFAYAVDASNNGTFCPITVDNAVKNVKGVSPEDIVDRIIIVASACFTGSNTYEQASYSNGGSQVSICAPGSNIYSAYYDSDYEEGTSLYAYLSGTSMAAPIVTGIASLVWSVNPSFTGAQVKRFVCDPANTKYEVADSTSETHLPTGTMRMVNALLAVEAAIKATEDYGTVTGHLEWSRITPNKFIGFTLTSAENGTVYRLMTDEAGNFSARLPSGEYVLNLDGNKKDVTVISGESSDIGAFRSVKVTIDFDAYRTAAKDNMQDFLTKLYLY